MAAIMLRTNILCMKWGHAYGVDYVNILYRAARAHMEREFRFICLTDDRTGLDNEIEVFPVPDMGLPAERIAHGGWPKLGVFAPKLYDVEGRVLFLDVDIVVTGGLDIFFEFEGGVRLIREWPQLGHRLSRRRALGGNSSVFAFDVGTQSQIYRVFMSDQAAAFGEFRNEQRFLAAHAQGLDYWPQGLCLSFKGDLMRPVPMNFIWPPRLVPRAARVVVFHGRPLPEEVGQNYWWGRGFRRGMAPIGWVRDYWQNYRRSDREELDKN